MPRQNKILSIVTPGIFYAGIDIGKNDCWVAPQAGRRRRFAFSLEGVEAMAGWLRELSNEGGVIRCAMEHTGVYSIAWAALIESCGLQCALLNPTRVKQYGQSSGQRSKTDKADCASILSAAMHWQAPARQPAPAAQARLALLLSHYRFLKKQRAALLNRIHAIGHLPEHGELLLPALEEMLTSFDQAIAQGRKQIRELIDLDDQLAPADKLLRSIPSIGEYSSAVLLVHHDKLRTATASQLTALFGLAPQHKQSGSSVHGKSHIDKQGNAVVRNSLYMCALSGGTYNPRLAEVRTRLKADGKPPKVVLVALSRHLLRIARSVIHSGRPFEYKPA